MGIRNRSFVFGGLGGGVCATAAATAAKVVEIAGFAPEPGDLFTVTFTNGNTVTAPTLNVNSTGAKKIRLNNTDASTVNCTLIAGATILLYYDGTYYQMMGSQRTTDTDTDNIDRLYWGTNVVAGANIYDYKIIMEGVDGKFYPLTAENGSSATKTVAVADLRIDGQILFYYSTTDVAAGNAFYSVYSEFSIGSLNYTFNSVSLTAPYPVYLKGTIDASGAFNLDNTTYTSWVTQSLPTTDDGFVYILLGWFNTANSLRLVATHPIYEYKEGKLRRYVPAHTHSAPSPLRAFDVVVATTDWVADSTFTGFAFRAPAVLTGATASLIPEVIFAHDDAIGGNFSNRARSATDLVYIYAKVAPTVDITLTMVECRT